jgi:mRNA-degrading endonuclease toxin of MazEF toxin-antitoxin module
LNVPEQGELYWADSQSEAPHPVIVVSRTDLNRGDYAVAVPLTSANLERRWNAPNTVPFKSGQFGLTKDCVAQCEAITLLNKSRPDPRPFGQLNDEAWRDLVRAIGNVICAECEPS